MLEWLQTVKLCSRLAQHRNRHLPARKLNPLEVSITRDGNVGNEMRQFIQTQSLRAVNECFGRIGMKIHQHHVGAGEYALRRDMHYIEDAFGARHARADRMTGIDAYRHARQTLHRGNLREIHEVSMWVPKVGLHATQAEDHAVIAFTGQIFRSVQGLVERNAETALDQHREFSLASDDFEQFEILRVPCADLQHDASRVACILQCLTDFRDVGFMGNLHGDDADAVLSGQFKYERQTVFSVPLERIRTGARLVSAHARALLALFLQCTHHDVDMLRRIHCTQPGEHMQGVLTETQALIIEVRLPVIALVTPEHAEFFRDAYDPFNAWQAFHLVDG